MCTKTKNSYGCGHCIKITEACRQTGCNDMDKWRYIQDRDCARCKAAGATSTRGKDGMGKYGRSRSNKLSCADSSSTSESPSSSGTVNMAVSPWLKSDLPSTKEKEWNSITRQKADDAWLIEHERRRSDLADLEDKASRMSIQSHRSSYRNSRKSSPQASYERIVEADCVEEPEEIDSLSSRRRTLKMLPYQVIEDSDRSPFHHQSRELSYDSKRSVQTRHHSTPTKAQRKAFSVTPVSEHDSTASRALVHTPKRRSTKTEPYYAHPQSCYFNSPAVANPMVGEQWNGHYEIIQPAPLKHDAYYPHSYQVY